VIDWFAMMVPLNTDVVPSVAELPTCQKTFAVLESRGALFKLPGRENGGE
jgi:hypothetical protein